MKKMFLSFALTLALLSGCSLRSGVQRPLCRVVTRIEVLWSRQEDDRRYTLTAMEEIQPVLIYLRTLESLGRPAQDPDRLDADSWKIVIHRSDGSKRVYRQQGEEYLSLDSSPWQRIDPKKGSHLQVLFHDGKR